jgi:hypothetical protein
MACLVVSLLACGGGGDSPTDASPSDSPSTNGKRVFVTSATFTGDLGGAAGADAKCMAAASAAGRGGTFKAWVSLSSENAIDRIAEAGPWIDFQNSMIFANKTALMGPPTTVLNTDEAGVNVQMIGAWTGTVIAGTLASDGNCLDWANGTIDENAHVGQVGNDTTEWTDLTTSSCAQSFHLYCFEQ